MGTLRQILSSEIEVLTGDGAHKAGVRKAEKEGSPRRIVG